MYLLVPILFIVTISLYFYLERKIKGHDFSLVNKIRPYIQFLLLVSIEIAIPCVAYIVYCILVNFIDEVTLIGLVPSIAITLMIIALICIPIKVNHNTPSPNNSFAIYLRSFRSDSINTIPNVKSISSLINNLYPIYEIGNPHEVLTIFRKHITMYKTDEDWQESVTELKNNAKIIILRLDGTEGLSWEINSIKKHLNKVLFIAYDETSYNEFMSVLHRNAFEEYTSFPVINNFPSIIWKHDNYWYSCDASEVMCYISQHPWQDKSVDHITNSMALWSNHFTGDKTFLINRFPTFLKGNRDIDMKFPLWSHILFSIFPFNQQFHRIFHRIEPKWINGNFLVKQCPACYGKEITEPATEQCTPDECGNTTVEEHLEHLIDSTFGFIFLQYKEAQCGKDDTISRIRQHHTKEDEIEGCQDRCRVDILSGRQAVHIGYCLERCRHTAVMQQYRHFFICIRNLNIIIEFISLQQFFDFFLGPCRHPAVEVEHGICAQHFPYDPCTVTLCHQQVIKEFNIFSRRC